MESSQGTIFLNRNFGKRPTKLDVQHVQQIVEKVNKIEQEQIFLPNYELQKSIDFFIHLIFFNTEECFPFAIARLTLKRIKRI